ncbi:hypothetical protein DPMN_041086 [Dreissena polymorpha]|uniref:Uncharacterized protein n=1 Tax=Dreissena polymorpha TaxID=45954 RepID=A0A9D4CYR2_DREPO|nr:hypothetical protein DPMN_041086 [Dreissena polymorpha]
MVRVPPLFLIQVHELMPALVPAPFPPHSFYAIWALCSFAVSGSTAARIPRPSFCLRFATACLTRLRTLRPLTDIVDFSLWMRRHKFLSITSIE